MQTPQDRPFETRKRRDRPATQRFAAKLAYLGTPFSGFQRQPGRRTVEGELVDALVDCGLSGGLGFASRTDAGVHARAQVVAFRVPAEVTVEDLRARLGKRLPTELRLEALAIAPRQFHPRWSATGKRYEYRIALGDGPFERAWKLERLDAGRLEGALDALRTAPALDGFTAAGAPRKPAPALSSLSCTTAGDTIELAFEGPAFRRYAIRHMVGAAVAEAVGHMPEGTCRALAGRQEPYRGVRAPADGLTLVRVDYPPELDPFVP